MREKVTITPEFKQAIIKYQKSKNISSFSEAFVELAAIGLQAATGESVQPHPGWGGWRGSENSIKALTDHRNADQDAATDSE